MRQYMSRVVTVEAMEITPENLGVVRDGSFVLHPQDGGCVTVLCLHEPQVGDFVVKQDKGGLELWSCNRFKRFYHTK